MSLRTQYDILKKREKHNFNWDVIIIQFSIDSQTLDVIVVDMVVIDHDMTFHRVSLHEMKPRKLISHQSG